MFSSSSPQSIHPLPPLLRLPIEILQQIISYIIPLETISHPLPGTAITSVSHRPPSHSLLNIHPHLTTELLAHFYYLSTWKLIFSHAFNFFRVDPDLRQLEQSPSLAHIRRVEVVFFCDILLLRDYPSFGMGSFADEISKRATRACEVLGKGRSLRSVVVSWIDTTGDGMWEHREQILGSLKGLRDAVAARGGEVVFEVGEINGPCGVDAEVFGGSLRDVLGTAKLVKTTASLAVDKLASAGYRLLAFDVRQERGYMGTGPGRTVRNFRRSGWRGAPPVLAPPSEVLEEDI